MKFLKLLNRNKTVEPTTYNAVYGSMVEKKIRIRYSQRDVEAIINNYLSEPDNPVYIAELNELQQYRKQCKAAVKKELNL